MEPVTHQVCKEFHTGFQTPELLGRNICLVTQSVVCLVTAAWATEYIKHLKTFDQETIF